MPAAIAPEVTIRYSFLREIELVDHAAQQVGVDLPARSDQAGADFDDDSHAYCNWLHVPVEMHRSFAIACFVREAPDISRGGQYLYPAIRMSFLAS